MAAPGNIAMGRSCKQFLQDPIAFNLILAGTFIVLVATGILLWGYRDGMSAPFLAVATFGMLKSDAAVKKLHFELDEEAPGQPQSDTAFLPHLKSVFQFGLTVFHARAVSLTLWNQSTGRRLNWQANRSDEISEVVISNPEPCLRSPDSNLQSAVYVREKQDLVCFGLDWKQRPIREVALQAYLKQSQHIPFHTLLVNSLRIGPQWHGVLAYADAPPPAIPSAELNRLQQLVALAASSIQFCEETFLAERAFERRKIARDLHDGVMQTLYAMDLQAALLIRPHQSAENETKRKLVKMQDLLRREIETLQIQISDLKQGRLSGALIAKCRQISTEFQRDTNISTRLQFDSGRVQYSPQLAFELTCLLAEALANVRKHSKATKVEIGLSMKDGICLDVRDNGCGFSFQGHRNLAALLQAGQGPRSICDRVYSLGGDLSINSSPGSGVHLKIRLPLYPAEDEGKTDRSLPVLFKEQSSGSSRVRKPVQSAGRTDGAFRRL